MDTSLNTRLILAALAAALLAPGAQAQAPMAGMDMGGAKATAGAGKPAAAALSITASVKPNPPRAGDNALDVAVTDAGGKPVTGLKLTATVAMTSMDMGTARPAFADAGGGHYTTTVTFGMAGPWRVVVKDQGRKLASLDFSADGKARWAPPPVKAGTPPAPTAGMPGVNTGGSPAAPPSPGPTAEGAPKPEAGSVAKSATVMAGMNMPGMDVSGRKDAGMASMTGTADMKTATVPQLQEEGTYTATGDEDWKAQTGFGHNAGMVGMMNQMMVGGSGMEGMKMPPMNMKFDEQNYAKPDASDTDSSMAGMDMGGKPGGAGKADNGGKPGSSSGGMAGMNMDAAPPMTKPDAPGGGKAMPGMKMDAPTIGSAPASVPVKITATPASAPKAGDNPLTISVIDSQGRPVTGAKISTTVAMTSMDMGATHPAVTEKGGGQYTTTATFSMAGPWRVQVRVTAPGQKPQVKSFDFTAK